MTRFAHGQVPTTFYRPQPAYVVAYNAPTSPKIVLDKSGPLKAYLATITPKYALLGSIITCESNWNPLAANKGSTAKGLAQFLASTWQSWGKGNVFDPYANMDAMVKLYNARGTLPWKSSENCWQQG